MRFVRSVLVLVLLVSSVSAAQTIETGGLANVDRESIAILGYDPVAYFVAGEPRKGKSSIQETRGDAIYLFESEANRTLFRESPEKYTPAYGGFCAFGMRFGQRSNVDPYSWAIVDDRLYLLLNKGTLTIWTPRSTA
jgi:YHS domain-containing protein